MCESRCVTSMPKRFAFSICALNSVSTSSALADLYTESTDENKKPFLFTKPGTSELEATGPPLQIIPFTCEGKVQTQIGCRMRTGISGYFRKPGTRDHDTG